MLRLLLCASFALAGCGGYDGEPVGTAAELREALDEVGPGDTVRVEAATISGSFEVPAGVTLEGAGAGATIIRGRITLTTSERTTTMRALTVESSRGTAVTLAGGGVATLEAVVVAGPIEDEATADTLAPDMSPEDAATHGIFVDGGRATFTDVSVHGFVQVAVLAMSAELDWTGGGIGATPATSPTAGTVGVGLYAIRSDVALADIDVGGVWDDAGFVPAFGALFLDGTTVDSQDVVVRDANGYGLVHVATGAISHRSLQGLNNDEPALWIQDVTATAYVGGPMTAFAGNGVAGIVVVDTADVTIEDATVDMTREAPHRSEPEDLTPPIVGDGIHVVGEPGMLTVARTTLTGNERAGIVFHLSALPPGGVMLTDVTVDGSGDQLGAVSQGARLPIGWDSGITRLGVTAANDTSFEMAGLEIDALGAVNPCELPPPPAL